MNILSGLWEVFLGILGLSLVVLVHEGGHYLAAGLTGIRVETFSVGFGRRLAGFRRKDTEYRLSLIPLGGYCRFYGEQSFRKALDEKLDYIPAEAGDFYAAPPLKRIIVSFSGPLANILFSIIVLTAISWIGFDEYYTMPRIILSSEWSQGSTSWPADEAGLQTGDIILAVDGKAVDRFHELRRHLVFRPNESILLNVNRSGQSLDLTIVPKLDKASGTAVIGVFNWVDPVVSQVNPGSLFETIGIRPGDRILSIEGNPIPHTVAFFRALDNFDSESVIMTVERDGRMIDAELQLGTAENIGIGFQRISGRSVQLNGIQALARGTTETIGTLGSTLRAIRMLFLGVEVRKAVSGPLRLISDTGAVVAEGFRSGIGSGLLWSFELIALISVSLAFLNLLPIPILDGGQILLFLIEMFRQRAISPRSIYRYQIVGTIIVFIMAISATMGDILHFNAW